MSVQSRVVSWFRDSARDLPWRGEDVTPWQILVSEVMLQQTPAERVIGPWRAWVERWPTPHDVAAAPRADILRQWGRLGYPGRALRLHAAAIALVQDHRGEVPADYDALRSLPGVGDYTASAVLAFAFGMRSTVLDTNVRRVIHRVWHGREHPPPAVTRGERDFATGLVPARAAQAALWSAAAMELGAVVCTSRAPACHVCPVQRDCVWRAAGRPVSDTARRTQGYAGTDRQVRGIVMRGLTTSSGSVAVADLAALWHDADQMDRAIASLVTDGLAEWTRAGRLRLPR